MERRLVALKKLAAVMLTFAVTGAAFLTTAGPAHAAQEAQPCARLSAGQVKYYGHGAQRVTFATTTDRLQTRALVTSCVRSGTRYVQEWQSPGYVGRSGFKPPGVPSGHTRFEFSPTGSYSVTEGFGVYNPGTRLGFRLLNRNSRWGGGGQYASNYNRYFESTSHVFPDENMWDFATRGDYRQGAVINYNRPPDSGITRGAGFAIFLHANPSPTAGCISLPEGLVTRYLRNAVPGDRIIMGAVGDIFTPHASNPLGAIARKYDAAGGQVALGSPTSREVSGLRGGGAYQTYQRAAIQWSPASGAHITAGAIRSTYRTAGSENGVLGYPTSDEIRNLRYGGVVQRFQGGGIYYTAATGARVSTGAIRGAYGRTGYENGPLAYPTSNEMGGLVRGGVHQAYQGGAIYYSPAGGAHPVRGAIGARYSSTGAQNGTLGYPTSDEIAIRGGVYQNFEGGSVMWSPATGAQISARGAIRGAYARSGYERGPLGFPTTNEIKGLRDGGVYQKYQGGIIYYSPASGAHSTRGAIRAAYAASGYENGPLRYPISDELASRDGGVVQEYQRGTMFYSPGTGARFTSGAIGAAYRASGSMDGRLGYPVANEQSGLKDGGSSQLFQRGAIVSSAAGAFPSGGAIRSAWLKAGGERGQLGYPTTAEYLTAEGATAQDYQGGRITFTAGVIKVTGLQE